MRAGRRFKAKHYVHTSDAEGHTAGWGMDYPARSGLSAAAKKSAAATIGRRRF